MQMVDYFNAVFFLQEPQALIPKAVEMKIVYVFFQTLPLTSSLFFFIFIPSLLEFASCRGIWILCTSNSFWCSYNQRLVITFRYCGIDLNK